MSLDLFATDIDQTEIDNSGKNRKFIDLFAGIGGFHLALESQGATCVFASERDEHARKTYKSNFDTSNFVFNSDIRKVSLDDIPDHDVLCAGFPCQPFSQAGLKKGFKDGDDSERGNLFYCILDIIEAKQPKSFILENVRHLIKHDEGRTFDTIQTLLKKAGYTVYYQVLKASDYNVPQLRPRVFIVGFKDADELPPFHFPAKKPLTYTMSDVFGAPCERDVGFTLRVGGRGSNIDDRRNWEFYRVNGEVRRIGIEESKKMMAYPSDYVFPVSHTQAMKQLGNSVCVEVVKQVSNSVFNYLNEHKEHFERDEINLKRSDFEKEGQMSVKRNKGELSEIYALCKIIYERFLHYGDVNAETTKDVVQVVKVHLDHAEVNLENAMITVQSFDVDNGNAIDIVNQPVTEFISSTELQEIVTAIKEGSSTFSNDSLDEKVEILGLEKSKGSSYEKADIQLSFLEKDMLFTKQGTSIKSFLGASPTLLNASQATNFIYQVKGLTPEQVDEVNEIEGRTKIKDRIQKISDFGGELEFIACENPVYQSTLKKVDTFMPNILAKSLLSFFSKETDNKLSSYPDKKVDDLDERDEITCRLKDFVKSTMLGIFPTNKWDGDLTANSVVLVKGDGDLVFYHTNKDSVLKEFFYKQTFFDTPSSTRHRFGSIYKEGSGYFFKLNLQLRLSDKIQ